MLQKLSRVRGLSIEEKSSVRLKPGSHTGRTLGDASGVSLNLHKRSERKKRGLLWWE